MLEGASPWKRFWAGMLDAVLIFICILAAAASTPRQINESDWFIAIVLLSPLVYVVLMPLTPLQGTLAMKLFRLKTVTQDGGKISIVQSVVRAVISMACVYISGGVLWALYSAYVNSTFKRYFIHDLATKTVIIQA